MVDTQPLKVSPVSSPDQDIFLIYSYIKHLLQHSISTPQPHHSASPEGSVQILPHVGPVFSAHQTSSGIDPLTVFTFRFYGPWESCFPLQASSGSSYPLLCCLCCFLPVEGQSPGSDYSWNADNSILSGYSQCHQED